MTTATITKQAEDQILSLAVNASELATSPRLAYMEVAKADLLQPMLELQQQQLGKFGYTAEQVTAIWEQLPQVVPFRISRGEAQRRG